MENSLETNMKICTLCRGGSTRTYKNMTGYIDGAFFDVYECQNCLASFVDPLHSDESIYNFIYNQAEKIPGYMRYQRYADLVKKVNNPLQLLAESENVYWGVKQALEQNFKSNDIKILEIGSGLGYLTYSLNKAGYEAIGVDLSHSAVERAQKKYGNFYEAGDIFELVENMQNMYDCVIMTEIIEHVENPKKFIEAALSSLKLGGKLILTTPNKDSSPKGIIWQSDVPPVHLWWFSEKSISKVAESLGCIPTFIDFTEYTKKYFEYGTSSNMEQIQASLPRLEKDGAVVKSREVFNIKSKLLGVVLHTRISNILRMLKQKTPSHRSSSMCVVVTKE